MTLTSVPIIDIGPFLSGDRDGKERVAAVVDKTCREVGFLVITNHGIDQVLVDEVFEASRAFFDLPLKEKLKVEKEGESGRGYRRFATEGNAIYSGLDTPPDLRETYGVPNKEGGRWPESLPDFREACLEYYGKMENLGFTITRMFAMAMKLPEDYFIPMVTPPRCSLALHHYPEQKEEPLPGQLRNGEHRDAGMLTVLRTERLHRPGGLQVNIDGKWADVPAVQDSFVINIGNMMMYWTNDRWVSTLHRVVNPSKDASGETRRLSIPVFFGPHDDAMLECLPSCCGPENPAKYPPRTAREWRVIEDAKLTNPPFRRQF